jgi:hypothetical protein
MRLIRVLAGASVIAVTSASALRADFKDFSNRCSPGAVHSCASLQLWTTAITSGPNAGGTAVTMWVRNLQGSFGFDNTGGSVLARIGIVTPPIGNAFGLQVTTTGTVGVHNSPLGQWTLRNGGSIGGTIEVTAGVTNNGNGGIIGCATPAPGILQPQRWFQTCDPSGWVVITFTTDNSWSANDAEVAFLSNQFQNPSGSGAGLECYTGTNPRTIQHCDAVTPEPVTMILLGSGLASMGGFGLVRRRKGKHVISD